MICDRKPNFSSPIGSPLLEFGGSEAFGSFDGSVDASWLSSSSSSCLMKPVTCYSVKPAMVASAKAIVSSGGSEKTA